MGERFYLQVRMELEMLKRATEAAQTQLGVARQRCEQLANPNGLRVARSWFDWVRPKAGAIAFLRFKGGLSSRTIVGESGPIHLVQSALETDASLMPLYRFMCEHADKEAGVPVSARPEAYRRGGGAAGGGGAMSEAEAEAVLREHFSLRR